MRNNKRRRNSNPRLLENTTKQGVGEYAQPPTIPAKVWFIESATHAESRAESLREVSALESGNRGSKKSHPMSWAGRNSTVSSNEGRKHGPSHTKVDPEMSELDAVGIPNLMAGRRNRILRKFRNDTRGTAEGRENSSRRFEYSRDCNSSAEVLGGGVPHRFQERFSTVSHRRCHGCSR